MDEGMPACEARHPKMNNHTVIIIRKKLLIITEGTLFAMETIFDAFNLLTKGVDSVKALYSAKWNILLQLF